MTGVAVVALLMAAATQAPLPYPTGTATIRGHVVRVDGPAVPRAEVRLTPADRPGPPRATTTDEGGAFEILALPAGRYKLTASKTGYIALEQVIALKAGEMRERVDFALRRHGAITGRVVDEHDEPIEGATITVKEIRSVGGHRQLVAVPGAQARPTNELGRFRVYGLEPGDYAVAAEAGHVGSDDLPSYPLTYFPGTTNAVAAHTIRIGVSEEVTNVEFALAPVHTARITGRTFTSSGEPFSGGVQMRPTSRSTGATAEPVGARAQPDGGFEFANVPPGEYVIQAFKGTEIGWQIVAVDGTDVVDLAVTTLPGSTVTGRVTFEGADAPKPTDVEIEMTPSDPDFTPFIGAPSRAEIHDDGTFEIEQVTGPCRLRVTRAPAGWKLTRVIVGGVDAMNAVLSFGTEAESLKDVEVVVSR